jgi:hypothetical protein
LEHLDDEAAALSELHRVTRSGGHLVAFVPAFAILWGYNDDFSHHRRRYRQAQLNERVATAGFSVERSGYFNMTLFLPTLMARLLQRALPFSTAGMEHDPRRGPLNAVLAALFRAELPLLSRARLPFGTSAFCVGRK